MEFTTAALVRLIPNGVGFFTPLFHGDQSNALYMQRYSSEHKIEQFVAINVDTPGIEPLPDRRSRRVGDEALFGFICLTGNLILGTRAEIAPSLRREAMQLEGKRLRRDISAFFSATATPIPLANAAVEQHDTIDQSILAEFTSIDDANVRQSPTRSERAMQRILARLVEKGYLPRLDPVVIARRDSRNNLPYVALRERVDQTRDRRRFVSLQAASPGRTA